MPMRWQETGDELRARFVVRATPVPPHWRAIPGHSLLKLFTDARAAFRDALVVLGLPLARRWLAQWLMGPTIIELDRDTFVVRRGRDQLMREPTLLLDGFHGGSWTAPASAAKALPPPREWTVFASFDDGRYVPLDLSIDDESEATALAAALESALRRLRQPHSYRD